MLTNLALTPEESKEESDFSAEQPKYAYGTSLYLDENVLQKLGMTSLPEVGTQFKLEGLVTVTSVSQRQEVDGETCMNVELQVTDMGLSSAGDNTRSDTERANMLYGDAS